MLTKARVKLTDETIPNVEYLRQVAQECDLPVKLP